MCEYKERELASDTSSAGIVLELKTKHECAGVYWIWSNNAPGLFEPSITPRHLLRLTGVNRATGGSRISVTGARRMAVCPGWGVGGGGWGGQAVVGWVTPVRCEKKPFLVTPGLE